METLKQMLIRHEEAREKPYRCPAGHLTIGVGWNMDANPLPEHIQAHLDATGRITGEDIGFLLDLSIKTATEACRRLFKGFDTFSETRRNALIDFVFNVGEGTAQKFVRARAAIAFQDWNRAADCMKDSKWFDQVGHRGIEIVKMIREDKP